MQVFIIESIDDTSTTYIEGVYSTWEKANETIDLWEKQDSPLNNPFGKLKYHIYERTLDE